jgi:hypothetical protein
MTRPEPPAVPLYDVVEGRPALATVYTRCPTCGVIAAVGGAEYRLTSTGEAAWEQDPAEEIRLTCAQAGHPYTVTTQAFLARDAVRTCGRKGCDAVFPCPAVADQVVCPACHLHQPGPFLHADPERGAYVDQVHADWMDDVRARLRRLRGGDQP